MAELWSDYTDMMVGELEATVKSKYNLSLKKLLTNPMQFADDKTVSVKIDNIKEDVNKYLDDVVGQLEEERKALENNAVKSDSLTNQLNQRISLEAKQVNVPVIKPYAVARDETRDEIVYVNSVDSSTLALIDKLTNSSTFVADMTYKYKDYNIGVWFFSGQKNYVVSVALEPNPVLNVEGSRTELNMLIDNAKEILKG